MISIIDTSVGSRILIVRLTPDFVGLFWTI